MTKHLLIATLISLSIISPTSGQNSAARITGCYSDLKLIEEEGLVVGAGSFNITKVKGKYSATFTELIGDGGEYTAGTKVRNLSVDEPRRRIRFDLPLLGEGREIEYVKGATGRITRSGIQMNWRGAFGRFGGSSKPFLARRTRNCS
ncbi:MAG: hypothetical protein WKF92_15785 [Pyrinomonadaceae bacterium]